MRSTINSLTLASYRVHHQNQILKRLKAFTNFDCSEHTLRNFSASPCECSELLVKSLQEMLSERFISLWLAVCERQVALSHSTKKTIVRALSCAKQLLLWLHNTHVTLLSGTLPSAARRLRCVLESVALCVKEYVRDLAVLNHSISQQDAYPRSKSSNLNRFPPPHLLF